uniref:Uncharacterized protein n=1 Tax=Arundo donax TaxID=35708 RepID=A0A0A8ZHM7_ARUDO
MLQGILHNALRLSIQGTRRLIKQQYPGIFQYGPCDSHPLFLATR